MDTDGQTAISVPTRSNLCWMAKLRGMHFLYFTFFNLPVDDLFLTEIYFPGTHDAGSFKGHSIGLVNTLAK